MSRIGVLDSWQDRARQWAAMHPLLQFFRFDRLPFYLQEVSRPFFDLAHSLDRTLPDNAEKTVSLRKLLESKDCAVRAVIFKADA